MGAGGNAMAFRVVCKVWNACIVSFDRCDDQRQPSHSYQLLSVASGHVSELLAKSQWSCDTFAGLSITVRWIAHTVPYALMLRNCGAF